MRNEANLPPPGRLGAVVAILFSLKEGNDVVERSMETLESPRELVWVADAAGNCTLVGMTGVFTVVRSSTSFGVDTDRVKRRCAWPAIGVPQIGRAAPWEFGLCLVMPMPTHLCSFRLA